MVLGGLIIIAAVANLPLAMANVALPSIGVAFNASQTQLNLVAVAYSLGLACSVLWLGALGDRYGRKLMCLLGVILAIPVALICRFCSNDPGFDRRQAARRLCRRYGLPDHAIADHGALGAWPRPDALDCLMGGDRRSDFSDWDRFWLACCWSLHLEFGFLRCHPAGGCGAVHGARYIPAHVNETSEAVDNLGGILSLIMIGALSWRSTLSPWPAYRSLAIGLLAMALITRILFIFRQRRARSPLYDLKIASRRTFWVAAVGGIIVFGSLMGAMFIGQQFLQDVLGYSTVNAGLADAAGGDFYGAGRATLGQNCRSNEARVLRCWPATFSSCLAS